MGRTTVVLVAVLAAYSAGLLSHALYQRWRPPALELSAGRNPPSAEVVGNQAHPVRFVPSSQPAAQDETLELPVIVARDVEKIRAFAGRQARIRGRVFRVGHSAKSNTYFLNFGPSREALTAVIFATGVELFEKTRQPPKLFENKEVELTGQIKDHPQFGLEVVLEDPKQIRILP
jgi:hypothetical protein